MYEKTLTIFNYYESPTTRDAYWYPHVLSGADLITDKEQSLKSTDQTQLTTHSYTSDIPPRMAI